jgi:hypothetical protein
VKPRGIKLLPVIEDEGNPTAGPVDGGGGNPPQPKGFFRRKKG